MRFAVERYLIHIHLLSAVVGSIDGKLFTIFKRHRHLLEQGAANYVLSGARANGIEANALNTYQAEVWPLSSSPQ